MAAEIEALTVRPIVTATFGVLALLGCDPAVSHMLALAPSPLGVDSAVTPAVAEATSVTVRLLERYGFRSVPRGNCDRLWEWTAGPTDARTTACLRSTPEGELQVRFYRFAAREFPPHVDTLRAMLADTLRTFGTVRERHGL